MRILRLFAMGLDIDDAKDGADWFLPYHDRTRGGSGSVFRLLYYPTLPPTAEYDPKVDIRAGAHSDYGTITLLFQREGQPGLEILADAETQEWHPVPVNPTSDAELPILVNVGDLLEFWTNGLLRSTVHRVTFPKAANGSRGEDRYSMAYFCHPLDDARLEPVPSHLVQGRKRWQDSDEKNLGESRVLTAKEHLEGRLAATYM
jgi:isopenicillin N synthase-like dioxygenase